MFILVTMYIRKKTSPNTKKTSVQIVDSKRTGNKVSQTIIRHIGSAINEYEIEKLIELAEYVKARLEEETKPQIFPAEELAELAISQRRKEKEDELEVKLKNLREEQRVVVGIHEIYGQVYKEIGYEHVFGTPARNLSNYQALKHLVMARIANPQSKRGSVIDLEKNFGIQIDLNKVYRMMDKLGEKEIEKIKQLSQENTMGLFDEPVDVIFYDCTTLYFESFTEDDLRENGYSKDGKYNQTQIILSLLVTQMGMPIGYEIYSGSTYEGDTLKDALFRVKKEYSINRVIFVADSGLLSLNNLNMLEAEGQPYIVGARLKNMRKEEKELILNNENYKINKDTQEEKLKEIEIKNGNRLIVSYSQKRAEKDKNERIKGIERLKKKIGKGKAIKSLMKNMGGSKKFLNVEGEGKITLNETIIAEESKWDGLHGIITNIKDKTAEELYSHYRGLWQVEETFRVTKHDLMVRPIFHWTARRIQAHIAICYIALVCVRTLEYRVARQYKKLSPEIIKNELLHVQVSILKDIETGLRYGMPSALSTEVKKIYQIMGKKVNITPFKIS